MANKEKIKRSTQKIRDEVDSIDEEIDEKGGKLRGDPVAEVY